MNSQISLPPYRQKRQKWFLPFLPVFTPPLSRKTWGVR